MVATIFRKISGSVACSAKLGYVSQDHVEDETMVWLHSSEGTGKGEQCGEGSVEEGAVFAVGAFQMNRSLSGRELRAE